MARGRGFCLSPSSEYGYSGVANRRCPFQCHRFLLEWLLTQEYTEKKACSNRPLEPDGNEGEEGAEGQWRYSMAQWPWSPAPLPASARGSLKCWQRKA